MDDKNTKIALNIIKQGNSYLDWLEFVYLYKQNEIQDIINLKIYEKNEIIEKIANKKEEEKENITQKLKKLEKINISKELIDNLEWKYPYLISSKIPSKTSVTKIKEMAQKLNNSNLDKIYKQEWAIPKFRKESNQITNAQKGTLIHLCIEQLNEKIEYTEEKIKDLIINLVNQKKITKEEANVIDIKKIYCFTKSKIWQQMKNAKKIMKETPFYCSIPANEIYKEDVEDSI